MKIALIIAIAFLGFITLGVTICLFVLDMFKVQEIIRSQEEKKKLLRDGDIKQQEVSLKCFGPFLLTCVWFTVLIGILVA